MSILSKLILGDPNEKALKKLQPTIDQINSLESGIEKLTDDQLKNKTQEFKDRLKNKETLDNLLPEAFAVVREVAKRVLKMRHYDVQLIAGLVLHRGEIAEMKTGEGKTLAATLPIYLNSLTEKGVHVITVNDYLAARDAVWMAQVYNFLGLSVSCVQHDKSFLYDENFDNEEDVDKERDEKANYKVEEKYLKPVTRKEAYAADITYGTNNEFGFDYLRDNMALDKDKQVQRELNYTIIDEVDSILIDEARTPLIISAPAEESGELYLKFAQIVPRLKENEDYNIDEKMRSATLTEKGLNNIEKLLGMGNIYNEGGIKMVHHLEEALKANALFKKDKDYVVKDGEVVIIDEFTGRLMPGRRYSEGLHQAIEAKEGVQVQKESRTLATITFQNLFRMYNKLSGMTGTAKTESEEFFQIYGLEVIVVPTNKPIARQDLADRIYSSEIGKFKAVVQEIKAKHEKGQPVLVGTISIERNELLGRMLAESGVPFNLLNAKQHEKEAQVIAQAGKVGAVTVATNMAGRGVDIILGGAPFNKEESEKVKALGGLHVLGTERHESRRIDNQLRGRAGRQGDPGSSQFYVSMEDDLMRVFGSDRMKNMMTRLGVPEDVPIENKLISRSIESAQTRVEGYNFDVRKHLVEYDDVMNKQREAIYRRRQALLENKDDLSKNVLEMVEDEINQVVSFHTAGENQADWNLKEIIEVVKTIFPIDKQMEEDLVRLKTESIDDLEARTKIIEYLVKVSNEHYKILKTQIAEQTRDDEVFVKIEKTILLNSIDSLWVDHLDAVSALRVGIGLRGYGQRDPLIEYKKETHMMFQSLLNLIQRQVVYSVYKIGLGLGVGGSIMSSGNLNLSGSQKGGQFANSQKKSVYDSQQRKQEVLAKPVDKDGNKIKANDPCTCGSGKKYKKCCG